MRTIKSVLTAPQIILPWRVKQTPPNIRRSAWTLLIIHDMLFRQKQRLGQFSESEENISSNFLADRLARLEEQKLVPMRSNPENGRQLVYTLTSKACDLTPVLVEIILWAAKHDPNTAVEPSFIHKAKLDRAQLIQEIKFLVENKTPDGP